jgi:hypothetical protein
MPRKRRRLPGKLAGTSSRVRKLECGCHLVISPWGTPHYAQRCPEHEKQAKLEEKDLSFWKMVQEMPLFPRLLYLGAGLGIVASLIFLLVGFIKEAFR